MNRHAAITLLVGAALLSVGAAQQPNKTARRLVDWFEIARLSEISEPQTELVTTRFRLLERREVCLDMALSQQQSNTVRSVYETPWEQVPGLPEFRARQKAARQEPGLSKEQREALNLASARGSARIIAQFRAQRLQTVLSPPQAERLEQLLLQTRGPLMLVVDTNLAAAVRLTPEQLGDLNGVVRQADEKLSPELRKFGRGFWAGYSANDTPESRAGEMRALIPELEQMIRERDENILRRLTADQITNLQIMEGKPLLIEWDPRQFADQPFDRAHQ